MNNWAFYPVFVATAISMAWWTYFAWREHDPAHPVELSKFALRSKWHATAYRIFMFLCPPLFGLTGIYYVALRIEDVFALTLWMVCVLGCMFAGTFLPRGGWQTVLHNIGAYSMAVAMLGLPIRLAMLLPQASVVLSIITVLMVVCIAMGSLIRRRHYVFYEVGFIFLSHISMIVAALAVN